jgi:hypothetical protein
MTSGETRRYRGLLAVLVLTAGGCSDDALTLSPLTSSLGGAPLPVSQSADAPVDVYARVARGALKCWFGPEGSLKKTHVFHAKAESPTAGGAAEIDIHTRETGSNHGVLRAYGITIAPASGGSLVEAQNFRFPEEQANLMTADVSRWVRGKEGCSIVGTGGWAAGPAPDPATVAKVSGKPKPAQKP